MSSTRCARPRTILTVLALVLLRLVAAAYTPLTFDEAYYWMWSKHLAGAITITADGGLVIRLGTLIGGDTDSACGWRRCCWRCR